MPLFKSLPEIFQIAAKLRTPNANRNQFRLREIQHLLIIFLDGLIALPQVLVGGVEHLSQKKQLFSARLLVCHLVTDW